MPHHPHFLLPCSRLAIILPNHNIKLIIPIRISKIKDLAYEPLVDLVTAHIHDVLGELQEVEAGGFDGVAVLLFSD